VILDIRTFPDEVLRKKNEPVTEIDESIITLLNDMVETMHDAKGVGLAAPQVGVNKRIIVVDTTAGDYPSSLYKMINPEILQLSGDPNISEEGCLSIPGEYETVVRPSNAVVKYLTPEGEEKILEAEGFLAKAIQHEIDHLNGVLFIDRIPMMKREIMKKRIRRRISIGDYIVGQG
jgi:peptide deformylase